MLVLTAGMLAACATAPMQGELDHARALMNTGRVKEAYTRLAELNAQYPGSVETTAAYKVALERYSGLLSSAASEATTQKRYDDADALYNVLAGLPGQGARAQSGLASVQTARGHAASVAVSGPVPVPPVAAATPLPPVAAAAPAVVPPPAPAATAPRPAAVSAPATAPTPAPSAARPAATVPPSAAAPAPAGGMANNVEEGLNRRISMQFKDASVRSLFDVISKTAGLNVIIDKDVPQDLKTSIFLKNTTVAAAIEKILITTQLSKRNLDDNTLLIFPDDPAKQHDHREMLVRAFHLGNADAKAVANSLKTILKANNMVVDEKLNMIMLRDTVEVIRAAEKIVALQDVPEPEVMLEVEILEVNVDYLRNLGVSWPSGVSFSVPTAENAGKLTLNDLMKLNSSGIGVSDLKLGINAQDKNGNLNLLANPRIRAKNREKARILIGERLPNITTTLNNSGFAAESINYIEVGLKLEFEPQVFAGNEVVIRIGLEVSAAQPATISTSNGSTAYQISTRNANTALRLKDGENQILAGLIQDQDVKQTTGLPWLSSVPILGRLFGTNSDQKNKKEIVLSITPRLVRGITRPESVEYSAGTGSSLRGRRPGGGEFGASADSTGQFGADPNSSLQQGGAQIEAIRIPLQSSPRRERDED